MSLKKCLWMFVEIDPSWISSRAAVRYLDSVIKTWRRFCWDVRVVPGHPGKWEREKLEKTFRERETKTKTEYTIENGVFCIRHLMLSATEFTMDIGVPPSLLIDKQIRACWNVTGEGEGSIKKEKVEGSTCGSPGHASEQWQQCHGPNLNDRVNYNGSLTEECGFRD